MGDEKGTTQTNAAERTGASQVAESAPPLGKWECPRCTFHVSNNHDECTMCGQPRPIFSQSAACTAVPPPGTGVVVRGLVGQQQSLNGKVGRVIGTHGQDRAIVQFGPP